MDFAKQADQPLFPKLLWNRPISRSGAGRLLLIGGHSGEFNDVQALYQLAEAAGIGEAHVILPDSLRKLLGEVPNTTFVPASLSGSLGKASLAEILYIATNFDTIAVGANLSNNSETSILIDSLIQKFHGPMVFFGDSLKALKHQMTLLTDRENTLIVVSMAELFGIANALQLPLQIKDGGVMNKLEIAQTIANQGKADYLLLGRDMIVTSDGQQSLTTAVSSMDFFAGASVAVASVFWTQNPSKRYEALTTAAYILKQARAKLVNKTDEVLTIQEIEKAMTEVMKNEDWE